MAVTEGDKELAVQIAESLLSYPHARREWADLIAGHREAAVAELEHMLDSAQDAVAVEREKVRKLVEAIEFAYADFDRLPCRCDEFGHSCGPCDGMQGVQAALAEYKGGSPC